VAAWRALGPWWDRQAGGAGGAFHRNVVAPSVEDLLVVQPGERVLEIACGHGGFARRLAERGASVVAFDVSEPFIERARLHARDHAHADRVAYHVVDATDEEAVCALGVEPFDAAVANLALMNFADIGPLMRALARVLRPGGRFVFAIIHPCFGKLALRSQRSGPVVRLLGRVLTAGVRIPGLNGRVRRALDDVEAVRHARRYLAGDVTQVDILTGLPTPHWNFHRSLGALLAPAFAAGFVLDGLVEPPLPDAPTRAALLVARLRGPR
jgi:SAM-dependent methyltransferase